MKEFIDVIIQVFAVGVGGIGVWFLWDLVTEFKTFKTETKTDILSLRKERDDFRSTVRNAELAIGLRVNEMQALHNDFRLTVNDAIMKANFQLEQFNIEMDSLVHKAKAFDEFMEKALKLFKHQDSQIKGIKVELQNLTVYKSGK